ncbi:MAG: hypothetical protein WDN26_20575 [Chitinophagaceae bacterium]
MNKKIYLPLIFLAFIFLIAWNLYGQTKPSPARQTWEYKTCSLYCNTDNKGWIERYEDGVSMGAPFSMLERMKELGAQGWELIAVVPLSNSYHNGYTNTNFENSRPETTPSVAGFTNQMSFYFKRQK